MAATWHDSTDKRLITPWYLAITRPRPAALIRRRQLGLILFVFVALLSLNLYSPAQPTLPMRVLASLLFILAAVPVWLWNSGKDNRLPLLPIIAFLYCIYYAVPVFVMEQYSLNSYSLSIISDSNIEYALLLACLGWLATLAGYYCPLSQRFTSHMPRIRLNWTDVNVLARLGAALGTVGCVLYYAGFTSRAYNTDYAQSVPASVRQVVFYLGELATIGIGILYVLEQAGYLARLYRIYLWGLLIPIRILVGLATGAIYQAMSLVLFLLLIRSA
jgi:hypothetical protein